MEKPKILITGGSGLLALNWFVTMRDRYEVVLVLHERTLSVPQAITCILDLHSPDSMTAALDLYDPKYVVHAAGFTSVEKCDEAPDTAHDVNVVIAGNVARACRARATPLVHISTDHLFSGGYAFVTEEAPLMPLNTYARTKAEAESLVSELYPEVLIIRTNFYGWGTSYRESFSDFILRSLRGGNVIILFDDIFYSPIIIEQLVKITERLLSCNASGVFNVVGSERLTKYDFGLRLAEVFGLDPSLVQRGSIADISKFVLRPRDMSLSNRKVCEFLGLDTGGVNEQLELLRAQEVRGIAKELAAL
jgi:dTDP-4-dehydrorhamnose reductase